MQLKTWDRLQAVRRLFSIGAVCLGLAGLGSTAFALDEPQPSLNDPVVVVNREKSTMQIVERFTKIVKLPGRVVRVDGFDPAVVNVAAASPTEFRIMAVAPGVTTIVFADENGAIYTVETFVAGDVRHLQAYIDRLFPGSAVKAVAVKDSVVLRGWVTRPENITAIVEIAEQFYPRVLNQMQVGGAQQVILKVKVMEVQRSKIRQLGLNFLFLDNNQFLSNTVGQLTQLSNLPGGFGSSGGNVFSQQSLSAAQVAAGLVHNSSLFQGFIEALKQENLLKILAEPTLNTSNGRPSNLLAGGEFPVVVPQGLGRNSVKYKQFGVQLEAVPTILGNGRVRLELAPEVSERDFTNSVTIGGITAPGLTTRRVNTQVEMEFGQTYMLAGLLSLRRLANTNKVPLFGEIPGIGALFRRVRYEEAETELVIMVTPELAGPMERCQVPPNPPGTFTSVPTATELFCDGMIEVPNYGGRCNGVCEMGGLPSSRLHYATVCEGGCPPNSPMMDFPADSNMMGPGQMPLPETAPMPGAPIPSAPPAAPAEERLPLLPQVAAACSGCGRLLGDQAHLL